MLNGLNTAQIQAVENTEGPMLIIAGAGSGKTRTVIERISKIILDGKAAPFEIMALTFTNKAANELRERLIARCGPGSQNITAGTFHSTCSRILRSHADKIGYSKSFVIYDNDDKLKVIKSVIRNNNLNIIYFPIKKIARSISRLKNKLIYPENNKGISFDQDYDCLNDLYRDYQNELKKCNAFDFDDLICMTVRLFEREKDILFEYQNRIKYVCVDEYQDTNYVQDRFIELISGLYKNICVVGDEDQSIYSWRGADINNILNFGNKYKNCLTVKLEQNYRSTPNVLNAAGMVIQKNKERIGKKLFSVSKSGENVTLSIHSSDSAEAAEICGKISDLFSKGHPLEQICILYRTNSQSRIIEDMLRRSALPYTIVGGHKFYERKEIKEIVAYLRLIHNRDDDVAFERIINFPPRGIGKKSIEKIRSVSSAKSISLYSSLKEYLKTNRNTSANKKISGFTDIIESLTNSSLSENVNSISKSVVMSTGILEYYASRSENEQDGSKTENIYEFLAATEDFSKNEKDNLTSDFLASVSLMSDIDSYNDRSKKVVMMTVHTAKGLEFDTVFIAGMNDGLFPIVRSGEDVNIEEERRLFYVAMTRARKRLFISSFIKRSRYMGGSSAFSPSRFLDDLPESVSVSKDKIIAGTESFTSKDDIEIRDIVFSKQFGEGIVLSSEYSGRKKIVTVDFDDHGIKKLIVKYAGLRKI